MNKELIIVTTALGNDGAERVLSELSSKWVEHGYKVCLLQTAPGYYGSSYTIDKRIKLLDVSAKSHNKVIRYIKMIKGVVNVLNQHKNATVISFLSPTIFVCGVASFFVNNKIIVSERNNPQKCPDKFYQRVLRDWAFCRANACVFQTTEALKMFPKKAQKNGVVILNPMNENLPDPFSGERKKVIIAACRMHPQKNLPMMINAFAIFHQKHPEYKLEIYGRSDEKIKAELEKLIAGLAIKNAVSLNEFCNDIHTKMLDATMYVSTSDYEGISNSMLEAMGMGVPIVVTDCPVGGARMVVQNEKNGMLVPVRDVKSFARAMCKIVEDPELSRNISLNAVQIKNRLPLEKIAQEWEAIL